MKRIFSKDISSSCQKGVLKGLQRCLYQPTQRNHPDPQGLRMSKQEGTHPLQFNKRRETSVWWTKALS